MMAYDERHIVQKNSVTYVELILGYSWSYQKTKSKVKLMFSEVSFVNDVLVYTC